MKSCLACIIFFTFLCGIYATEVFAPAPKVAVYNFTDGDFTFLESLDLTAVLSYSTDKGVKKNATVVLPKNATLDKDESSVNDTVATLLLTFGDLDTSNLTQTFTVNKGYFEMTSIVLSMMFDNHTFPGAKEEGGTFKLENLKLFHTSVGKSYSCKSDVEENGKDIFLTFSSMHLQPFKVADKKFSEASQCEADANTTTASPTTVGPTDVTGMTTVMTSVMTTVEPPKPVDNNRFNLTKDGKFCLLDYLNADFAVKDNKGHKHFISLVNATVVKDKSRCGNVTTNTTAILAVRFGKNKVDNFTQEFSLDTKNFFLKKIDLYVVSGKTDFYFKFTIDKNDTFRTPINESWKCDANVTIDHEDKKNNTLTISFAKVKLQPFAVNKTGTFSKSNECAQDEVINNIVPIAVGCALAVLVIIVLIAYLIGRRNSSRSGYESV